ncbi:hypothetical protein IMX26_01245 [Clostridium sp. 'deep sea']|uniref:hypothetical protein n=1 Tax=Clostridium sp. 'deep sea' TaxID=2779445 RepID=UPI0018966DEF|nr:hypothetical protein [Clostridium sp. 'deep sea']QOR35499.1 hypothetical protein IMX26_01245 [Clostridium sp. 'deep sea']
MYKKIVGVALATVMSLTTLGVNNVNLGDEFNSKNIERVEVTNSLENQELNLVSLTGNESIRYLICKIMHVPSFKSFQEYKSRLMVDVTEEVLSKAENIYNKAMLLDKAGNIEELNKVWLEFNKLGLEYLGQYEYYDYFYETALFNAFMPKEIEEKAKSLYNNAIKAEKENNKEKAIKLWAELQDMKLFNKVFEPEDTYECLKGNGIRYISCLQINEPDFDSFDDYKNRLLVNITNEELEKAKDLYNKAMSLQNRRDYSGANHIWNEMSELGLLEYTDQYKFGPFEYISPFIKQELSEEEYLKAERLYNDAVKAEKGNNAKEASRLWNELQRLTTIYK